MASLAFRSILRTSPQTLRSNCQYLPTRLLAAAYVARMSNISTLDVKYPYSYIEHIELHDLPLHRLPSLPASPSIVRRSSRPRQPRSFLSNTLPKSSDERKSPLQPSFTANHRSMLKTSRNSRQFLVLRRAS